MKKSLLAVVFAMVAMASSAQIYVGGSLGYSSTSDKISNDGTELKNESTGRLNFSPEVGWVMNDEWSFGLLFNYISSSSNDKKNNVKTSASEWSVRPYARYTFYRLDKLSFFADGVLGVSSPEENWTEVSVVVRPGVSVSLTENISLLSTINVLEYTSKSYNKDKAKYSKSNLAVDARASIASFSLYYTF